MNEENLEIRISPEDRSKEIARDVLEGKRQLLFAATKEGIEPGKAVLVVELGMDIGDDRMSTFICDTLRCVGSILLRLDSILQRARQPQ